jgi:hypothetical protein
MKKAQSVVEYIVAVILFIIIVIYMLNIFFDRIPEEISKIEEQELCSEAESMANSFLDTPGNPSNWETGANITTLGFGRASAEPGIDYNKWTTAVSRGSYNISEETGLNYTFHISYFIYALNYTYDDVPSAASGGNPSVFISRSRGNYINVSAGSSSTRAYLNLTLFFPDASSVTLGNCPDGANLEAGETPGTTSRNGGIEVFMNWTITGGDDDCTSLLPSPVPKLVYITKAKFENQTIGEFDIYAGNHTKIKDEFGSNEYLVVDKSYCEISRKRLIYNNSELFPARFIIRTW